MNRNIIIAVFILVLLIIYFTTVFQPKPLTSEHMAPFADKTFVDKSMDKFFVDMMPCSKDCCGDQWPVPFDGLSVKEIQDCFPGRNNYGPYVRTNYTCGLGIGGSGCPCVNRDAYNLLANRGMSIGGRIDPTFRTGENANIITNDTQFLAPNSSVQKSVFTDDRKLNDLELQRILHDITSNVTVSSTAPLPR